MSGQKQVLIRTDADLHKQLKHYCIDKGITLNQLVVDAISEKITKKPESDSQRADLPVKLGKIPNKNLAPEFKLVDVKNIRNPVSLSKDDPNVEELAQNIVRANGLLKPILLIQLGTDDYEVLSAISVLHACIRAKEIDPVKFEMVNAFIIPKDLVEAAKFQRV